MQRRLALLFLFAAVADAEAGRLIRGGRSGSPPPPPPPPASPGYVPDPPFFLQVTSQSAGSVSLVCQAPTERADGSAISNDAVVTYRWRVRRTDTGALVGSTPIDVSAPTLTATITGLPATTMRATAAAINGAGESDESMPVEWVGT